MNETIVMFLKIFILIRNNIKTHNLTENSPVLPLSQILLLKMNKFSSDKEPNTIECLVIKSDGIEEQCTGNFVISNFPLAYDKDEKPIISTRIQNINDKIHIFDNEDNNEKLNYKHDGYFYSSYLPDSDNSICFVFNLKHPKVLNKNYEEIDASYVDYSDISNPKFYDVNGNEVTDVCIGYEGAIIKFYDKNDKEINRVRTFEIVDGKLRINSYSPKNNTSCFDGYGIFERKAYIIPTDANFRFIPNTYFYIDRNNNLTNIFDKLSANIKKTQTIDNKDKTTTNNTYTTLSFPLFLMIMIQFIFEF